ncbi:MULTISPECIES: chaperone modulator CbpM [Comamonas]|jgi:chaperone modulatory protein CbpM|uniref:MerR family transcriptional regulator n=2 Tax=Comamonas TaxID=283 RepID=A0A1Y1J5Q7_COMTE|nr:MULTISPECIES: chaperone modulator CbpM [Comamonas]ACY32537.1 transcriptional regulatory protein, MerR family [Comamonas thiooxydans]EFI62791.1 transcriptional regulatory protein, MerR family [Comamonas thiooxydans]KGG82764.1 MerR family transcriptional regulator [Comamonas thiooxydans]KGG85260.1 MerR family transcriptional regulator [Comamonas thiooxydans]KGG92907.1 MerR family transcriptional regulator [Comamonas thiooxydans]
MSPSHYPFYEPAELLEQAVLDLHELARHCCTSPQWVIEHVQTGVISYDNEGQLREISHEQWRFSSQTLVRARRIAQLEHSFDADPQLAALTTDLIEEVQQLRRKLKNLQG